MKKVANKTHIFESAVYACLLCIISISGMARAQQDYGIHDPSSFVKEGDRYYTFYTSNGVECAYSTDLCTWRRGGRIFPSGFPAWINTYVSDFGGHFWAPQVHYMNNKWHVYYSCSSFGSRGSAIGLATSASLATPNWEDQGMVVNTNDNSDHNAIDADILSHNGRVWLVYGSYWSGIVMTELDTLTGKPIDRNNRSYVVNGNPEAAFAMHYGDYYYMFFNRGSCCNGTSSTYYINVGRSTSPTGPFLDKDGVSTSNRGGTVILNTQGRYIGPGHFGYFSEGNREYMSYHYYDGNQNGASKLKISAISWVDGWPVIDTDFDPCNPGTIDDCAGMANGSAYIDGCGTCVEGTTGLQPCAQDCNGDWGGEAHEDECGICVGGNTGAFPCAGSIQGENAIEFEGVIESVNGGYTGDGYLNYNNEANTSATWSICSNSASISRVSIRYANGGQTYRNLSVSVNGAEQINNLQFPPASSWTDWQSVTADINFQQGNNLITLTSLSSEGGPNIDLFTFSDEHLQECATGIADRTADVTKDSELKYANGNISFFMENDNYISIGIYTVSGQKVKDFFTGKAKKGFNEIGVKSSEFTKGMYLLSFKCGNVIKHTKLINIVKWARPGN